MKPRFTEAHRFRRPYKAALDTDIRKTFDEERKRLDSDKQERDVKVREFRKKT